MPVNATYEFDLAKKKFEQASDTKEKLQGLQEMLAALPKHKGTEKIQKELKTKISKYRELLKKEKSIKKGSHQLSIKKEGAATVCILGISNSGKSSLLSKLTNAKPKISEYEFTTTKPEMGIIDYKGIKIQLIEMPPIVKNYEQMDKGPLFLSFIRNGDLLLFLLNLNKNQKEQLKLLY
ncbi:50S ribosome-binding GTPase [archaeon]|nr:50S ribosome-binding GTPase [archaeon]